MQMHSPNTLGSKVLIGCYIGCHINYGRVLNYIFLLGVHGVESRTAHHVSGQHSSAGSTKASSPLSTISTRSGLAQTHTLSGPPIAKSSTPQSAGQKPSVKPREKENHPATNVEKVGGSSGNLKTRSYASQDMGYLTSSHCTDIKS